MSAMEQTSSSPVLDFYAGAKVLITGGTGFLGKSLLDKLLRVYFSDPPITEKNFLNVINSLPNEKIDEISPYLIKPWPNNYAYTKAIAESIIVDNIKDYPVVVLRPSIVMGSYKEPVPGWTDNLNGPTGILAGVGSGLLRVLWVDKNVNANLVPVDMVVNALLCSAWDVANNKNTSENYNKKKLYEKMDSKENSEIIAEKNLKVYNFVSKKDNSITWEDFLKINFKHGVKYPMEVFIWYYTVSLFKMKLFFNIFTVLYHFIPGLFMDMVLFLIGKKTQFIKAYKKIYSFSSALAFFANHEWHFKYKNVDNLWDRLSDEDKKLFHFNMSELDWDEYFKNVIKGLRCFIFKLSESSIERCRKKLFMFWVLHKLLQVFLAGLFIWLVNKYIFQIGNFFYNKPIEESIVLTQKMVTNSS
ncbi:conserved hypothetical protein [Pediculus humanus corporis]|uniref:Fatty acyl-CoA reductase n=1 Tax=Pediculus humanus subsp. corporis TaxID=121224 RepID=E0VLA4_PEDHC|nr:uncharacterized protein Phum_PHUM285160 [Pediculus humanus corporis]EEB14160.1 conserved hypothetical protein [Pediculus humanus corporis]